MKLNELHDNPGASRKKKRVARGPGSGKGKTAGRGVKGQKARSGNMRFEGFEGGQSPLQLEQAPRRVRSLRCHLHRIECDSDGRELDIRTVDTISVKSYDWQKQDDAEILKPPSPQSDS